jgi:hypothetical protein
MDMRTWIVRVIWLALLAFMGFYIYGLVLGAFTPFELVGCTVLAVVIAVVFPFHLWRTKRAISDETDPSHEEITRTAQEQHERRGF